MVRITRIRYGCWRFLSDTAVLHFDTDFSKIYGDIIFNYIMSLLSPTLVSQTHPFCRIFQIQGDPKKTEPIKMFINPT